MSTCCANCNLHDAFVAWNEGFLYIDGAGNYRLRKLATSGQKGQIAPWNRDIKRLFPNDVDAFHRTAGLVA